MVSVKKQLISGITYTAIAKYSGIVISLVVTAILARLISPSDFGIIAIAMVIISFFGVFSDLGISPAIIQNKDLSKKELSDIFSFTLWIGIFISILFFLLSGLIAKYYDSKILRSICQLLSVNLLANTLNIVPNALLMKNKEFKFIAIRTLMIQFLAGIISVIAALNGAGLYALLINPIFSSITVSIVSYCKYPQKLKITLGFHSISKIFTFSFYQFWFNIVNFFSRNLDKLLIGKYMGMTPLGYYEKSYRLMMLPLQNITFVITPVMHPVLSQFQNDLKHLSWSYLRIVKLLAFVGMALSVFLCFSSREIVLIVFGPQWLKSVSVFQILSITVGMQIILSTSGSIFQAANNTKHMFISGCSSAVLMVSGILCGIFIFKTLEAVAWGISIAIFLTFIQAFFIMYKFTFKLSIIPFLKQFISPLILSAILILLFSILSLFVNNMNIIFSFILKGILFVTVSLLYIQYTHVYDIKKAIITLKEKYLSSKN
ncbi:MAG: lipopolysaccharide biosynthesis protein [Bacteroidales bacterium]